MILFLSSASQDPYGKERNLVRKCGCQRFLIGFCLSQVEIGDKTKLTEPKGGAMAYVPTNFLLYQKSLGRLDGEMAVKVAIWGPNMPRNGPISSR
jgi:hypothetical protein